MGRMKLFFASCFAPQALGPSTITISQQGSLAQKSELCVSALDIAAANSSRGDTVPTVASCSSVASSRGDGPLPLPSLGGHPVSGGRSSDGQRCEVTAIVSQPASNASSSKSSGMSSNSTVSVQSLAAGVLADGQFLDSGDKTTTMGSFLARTYSPFQTSAAVPFASKERQDEVVAGISSSAVGMGTLNLSTEDSPATPLDFPMSTNARATSFASIGAQGSTQDSSSIVFKPPTASNRADSRHLTYCSPDRHPSVVLALQQSLSMQSLSMRLSLPSLASGGVPSPQALRPPSITISNCRTDSRQLANASAVNPNTATTTGSGGPFATVSFLGSDPSGTQTINSGSGGQQSAVVTISGMDNLPRLGSRCGSGSGEDRSPPLLSPHPAPGGGPSSPRLLLAPPSALQGCDENPTPHCLAPPPPLLNFQGALRGPHAGSGQQPFTANVVAVGGFPGGGGGMGGSGGNGMGGSGGGSQPPHPADKFLRFTELETCLGELRDLSFIGSGASGFVYSGMWCGMPVAVKFMLSGDVSQVQRQQREAALSRLASHPHLVQTYAVAAAQLTTAHFQTDPALRRMSGLSHADLLSTCAGGAMAADLYGTSSLSPAPSAVDAVRSLAISPSPSLPRSGNPAAAASAASNIAAVATTALLSTGSPSTRPSAEFERHTVYGQVQYRSPFAINGCSPSTCVSGEQTPVAAGGTAPATPATHGVGARPGAGVQQLLMRQQLRHRLSGHIPGAAGGICSMPNATVDEVPAQPAAQSSSAAAAAAGAGGHNGSTPPPSARLARAAGRPQISSNAGAHPHHQTGLATSISTVEIEVSSAFQVDAKEDSFEMSASDGNGLMLFQPSDVLTQMGARPGQWLTAVIMEEMDRGSLHRTIHGGVFNPATSPLSKRHRVRGMVRTLLEVAQGMAHLHSAGLVHGDLKPANVLLKANPRDLRGFIAKVSDFGVTRALAEGATQATVSTSDWGTVIYTAPEVFNGRAGMPSDVFSFGALTWHLATGQLPHEDLNPFAVMLAVSRGELELDWPASVPKPLRKLGRLCMQHNPASRPTFNEIARALRKLEAKMRACSNATSTASIGGGVYSSGGSPGAGMSYSLPSTPRAGRGGGASAAAAVAARTPALTCLA